MGRHLRRPDLLQGGMKMSPLNTTSPTEQTRPINWTGLLEPAEISVMAHLAAGFTDQTNVVFWLVNEAKGPREDEREVMGCVHPVRLCRAIPCHSLSLHCIDVSGSLPANGVEGTVRIAKIDGAAD